MTDSSLKPKTKRSPWAWVPTLYFAEGIPYVVVMTVSVIMYKRFGLSNTEIALYTGWLYLPWVIKPLWSPFVDIIKTKRWWVVTMQLLIGAGTYASRHAPHAQGTKGSVFYIFILVQNDDASAQGARQTL